MLRITSDLEPDNSDHHGLRPQPTPSGRHLDKSASFKDAVMRLFPEGERPDSRACVLA